jgi:diguanylate cyclase (GGDEF)-like protein
MTSFVARRGLLRAALSLAPECAAILCLLVLMWSGIWVTLQNQHSSALEGAARDTTNLAHAFEENTQRIVAGADQVLLALRAAYARDGASFNLRDWVRRENSPDWLTAQIAIIGPDGMSISSTAGGQRVSVADREHFIAQRGSASDRLFISKPVLGRSSGRWTIQLTRRMLAESGAFSGIVVLSVDCYQLSGFYESLNLRQGYISLVGLDGVVRARGPVVADAIGSTMELDGPAAEVLNNPYGTIRIPAEHGQLTMSYRRLGAYPLVVTVAFGDKAVLSAYRRSRLGLLWFAGLASAAILTLGIVWLRQRKRSIASREALTLTLESMNQGLVMIDGDEKVRVLNARALELLGLPADMLPILRSNRSNERGLSQWRLLAALHEELVRRRNVEGQADGKPALECNTSLIPGGGVVHVMTDVTARYAADRRIRHMALHDQLTGLGNRALLNERIDRLTETGSTSGQPFAVLSIDLNGFKRLSDTLGQDLGDQLLIAAAARLGSVVPEADLLTRSGGGEFAVLSAAACQPAASQELALALLGAFEEPFVIAGQQLRPGLSVGIARYPEHGATRAELVRNADLALFAAMADHAAPLQVFEPAMAERVQDRLQLEEELRAAIEGDQLYLEYQPQFRASSLEVVGFEALVRWNHPTRGRMRPDLFIPLAEETGMIITLGRKILEQACRAALQWPERIRIGVNLSPVQFRDPDLLATISEVLAKTGLPASRLELEVTEGVLIADEQQALQTLSALRERGIALALDDFGTGYASLSYLRKFPFERIKLDRSFVQAQVIEDRSRHILQSILGLSRKLGLGVIAEGVETRTQLHLLRQQGCQDIQGFLVGKPMSPAEAARMISPASEGRPGPREAGVRRVGTERPGSFATLAE